MHSIVLIAESSTISFSISVSTSIQTRSLIEQLFLLMTMILYTDCSLQVIMTELDGSCFYSLDAFPAFIVLHQTQEGRAVKIMVICLVFPRT